MNRLLPFIVTGTLALSSVWAGIDGYFRTEARIADDLTRALVLTAQERPVDWLSTDTIRCFRGHLQMTELREQAYLTFCLMDEPRRRHAGTVGSDTLAVGDAVHAQGYATCSVLNVWWMSDQRLAGLLALMTLLSLFGLKPRRHWTTNWPTPNPSPREGSSERLNTSGNESPSLGEGIGVGQLGVGQLGYQLAAPTELSTVLTPMQLQLIELFQASPTGELTKQQICDALWPKKDNASETLYTLIHRIKPVLEQHGRLRIVSNRGRSYRITAIDTE